MRDAIVLFLFLFNIGARLFPLSFLLFFFFVFFSFRKRKRVFDLINSTVCCCSFIRSSRFFVLGLIYQLYYTRTICSTTCCWQISALPVGSDRHRCCCFGNGGNVSGLHTCQTSPVAASRILCKRRTCLACLDLRCCRIIQLSWQPTRFYLFLFELKTTVG